MTPFHEVASVVFTQAGSLLQLGVKSMAAIPLAVNSSSAATRYIAYGWAALTGTHLVMSHPPVRDRLVKLTGSENNFRGVYSAVALAAFVPTTVLYIR